nr:HAD-IA family hydrolase [Jannaschia sp. Os4]
MIEWRPERFFDHRVGEARRRDLFDAVDLHAMNDRVDAGEAFHDVLEETRAAHPAFDREIALWRDNWTALAGPEIPRSVRLMRALQAKGMPVVSLTNFGIQTYEMARPVWPFLSDFDRDHISGHLGVIKPDPAIYEAVERSTGLSGGALLFADDRADNIAAAAERGWRTHLFDGPEGWADRLVAEGLLTEEEAA